MMRKKIVAGIVVLSIIVTFIIRLTVYTEDCNLLILLATFIAVCAALTMVVGIFRLLTKAR